jgi:type IV pilus assembly protein PilQ
MLKKNKLLIFILLFLYKFSFSTNVSLDFKNADIKDVLRIIGEYGNLNIVVDKEVSGSITIKLKDVDIMDALKYILEANNLTMSVEKNILFVKKKLEKKEEKIETEMRIFKCKYVNAEDIEKVISKFISPYGKVSVFIEKIVGGWEISGLQAGQTSGIGKKIREASRSQDRPVYLIVEDIPENIKKMENIINSLDLKKKQISIEVFFIEINHDSIQEIGVNWKYMNKDYRDKGGWQFQTDLGGTSYEFSGLIVSYEDLVKNQFIKKIEALQQEKKAKILSNPRIVVTEEQKAYILVGEKYPVIDTNVSPGTTPIITESLRNYEPVGISLYVIPKIIENDKINLIIHPEVSELGEDVVGTTGVKYKRIKTRELDTQINVKDGYVVVIGGLLKREKSEVENKVPLLGDIPILGNLFKRRRNVETNRELLIFIIPKIVKEEISFEKDLKEKIQNLEK